MLRLYISMAYLRGEGPGNPTAVETVTRGHIVILCLLRVP